MEPRSAFAHTNATDVRDEDGRSSSGVREKKRAKGKRREIRETLELTREEFRAAVENFRADYSTSSRIQPLGVEDARHNPW